MPNEDARASYFWYLNNFYHWQKINYMSGNARLLYYSLLGLFNEAGWPESVQVDNYRLMSMVDTRTERVAISARDKLVDSGFIKYDKGSKGSPNKYYLTKYTLQKVSESDSVSVSVSGSVSVSESDSVSVSPKCSHIKTKTKDLDKDIPPQPPRGPGRGGKTDYEAFREVFIEECPSLPQPGPASEWTETRKKVLRSKGLSVDEFREFCRRVQASDFLTGRANGWQGCSLDWLLKPANWQKVVEGNYDNHRTHQTSYNIDELAAQSVLDLPDEL